MADELFHVVKGFVAAVAGLLHQMLSIQVLSDARVSDTIRANECTSESTEKSGSL
jgi:hypothetical protein